MIQDSSSTWRTNWRSLRKRGTKKRTNNSNHTSILKCSVFILLKQEIRSQRGSLTGFMSCCSSGDGRLDMAHMRLRDFIWTDSAKLILIISTRFFCHQILTNSLFIDVMFIGLKRGLARVSSNPSSFHFYLIIT